MVRISLLVGSACVIISLLTPGANACEKECRKYPSEFLAKKYSDLLQSQLDNLPSGDRSRANSLVNKALNRIRGRNGVIDSTIFSKFHSNCHDKPPYRSPNEVCGSAKSIACFAPWSHRDSVFDSVHKAVVKVLKDTFRDENALVRKELVDSVRTACPGDCKSWEKPFQSLMLEWEEREHHNVYKGRLPNCSNGRLGF
ncbi:hypothetical protein BGZ76_002288 [Entomortierella beljakovae]|nr:hypothetical protein BGZ76_002288 [Entomortierella beljakovae]